MNSTSQSAQLLAACAGVLLSLGAAYVPGFSGWYQGLAGTYKRLLMLGLLAGAGVLAFGLGCARQAAGAAGAWPVLDLPALECSRAGAWQLLAAFLSALVANQATYLIAVTGGGGHEGESKTKTSPRRHEGHEVLPSIEFGIDTPKKPTALTSPRQAPSTPSCDGSPSVKNAGNKDFCSGPTRDAGLPAPTGAAGRSEFDLAAALQRVLADLERSGVFEAEHNTSRRRGSRKPPV